jgi:outer membrane protein assembly factor BamE (lipoprotein component of BamABCDE complex)
MKQIISRSLPGLLSIVLFCAGCDQSVSKPRFTPANFDKITVGMSKTQVEEILGPPTNVASKQLLVFGDQSRWDPVTTYRYEDGQKFAEITLKNDQVEKKNSNLDGEPR